MVSYIALKYTKRLLFIYSKPIGNRSRGHNFTVVLGTLHADALSGILHVTLKLMAN